MDSQRSLELHTRVLRIWHLAMLRFAVTRENADKLGVLTAANEIDRVGRGHESNPDFRFFRKTSTELCAAILGRNEAAEKMLRRYLAQIDEARLKRALAVALEIQLPQRTAVKERSKLGPSLWRGLPARGHLRP